MRPIGVVLAVLLVLALPCVGASQDPWAGQTLAEALERLRAEGLNLIYSSELVRPYLRVSSEPEGTTPREVLDDLLRPHGLAVREGPNGALVVVPAPRPDPEAGTIRGRVRAQDTGRPLAGATVRIVGLDEQVWSARDGSFVLDGLRPGAHTVEVRIAGYVAIRLDEVVVAPGAVAEVLAVLVPQPRFLQEVVVTPSQYGILNGQPESRLFLDRGEVQRLPHLSDDLFRVVHRLPGVAAGDISATFGIRGGASNEVMILLDGLEIYEPYHLKDFVSVLSIIDSEAVGGVDLLAGGFPVEYGDSMSGVVEIGSALPEERHRSLGASLLVGRVMAGGTTGQENGTWLVSLRRGYLDWVFDWVEKMGEEVDLVTRPEYYDVFVSWRRPVGERALFTTHLLGSRDRFHFLEDDGEEDATARYSSWYLWANLFNSWQGGLSARSMVSVSQVRHDIEGVSDNVGESYTWTDDERQFGTLGLRQDWILEPSRSHLLKWGTEVRHTRASYDHRSYYENYDTLFTGGPPTVTELDIESEPSGWQYALYTADRFRLAPGVTAEAGIRWDRQTWTPGEDQISPRLNLVWELGSSGTVRASWGRFAQSQGIHELQVEDGLDTFFPAQWAEHRVVSYQGKTPSGLGFRIEAYRKTMTDLRPRFENLYEPIDILPAGESDRVGLVPERARARGLEVVLKSAARGRWTWWVNYALSRAEDRIDGTWQPRSWDQRHAASGSVNWQAGKGWNLNLAGVFHSGWPTTPVSAYWEALPDDTWVIRSELGERNSARYPSYLRFDLRLSRTVSLRRGTLRYFIEVTNLLNRENVRSTSDIVFGALADGTIITDIELEGSMPFLPSFGISWEF